MFCSRRFFMLVRTFLIVGTVFLPTLVSAGGGPTVIKVVIPDFQLEVTGDGVFTRDFVLDEPVSLDGVSYVHWEQLWSQVSREGGPDGLRYGSKVDFTLMSNGQESLTPFWTANVNTLARPLAQKVRKGFTVNAMDGVEIDTIRLTVTTPTPLTPSPIPTGSGSKATVRGLGADNSLTFRFFRGSLGEELNQLLSIGFARIDYLGPGAIPWNVRVFDEPLSTEFLRFVNQDGPLWEARCVLCGGMFESQLLLDGHSDESPAVIVLDDAFSPSRGEPCPEAISFTVSEELSRRDHDLIDERAIIGMRWRINAVAGCNMSVVPLFEPVRVHFAYDVLPCGGKEVVRFLRGDANTDGGINIADAVSIFGWLFQGGGRPS